MPVVQPVIGTVINTHIHMIIVGKSMPVDNYEQYKRVINQITGRLYMHIYIYIYIYIYIERERERERETETETETERQRQRDRETERQRGTETEEKENLSKVLVIFKVSESIGPNSHIRITSVYISLSKCLEVFGAEKRCPESPPEIAFACRVSDSKQLLSTEQRTLVYSQFVEFTAPTKRGVHGCEERRLLQKAEHDGMMLNSTFYPINVFFVCVIVFVFACLCLLFLVLFLFSPFTRLLWDFSCCICVWTDLDYLGVVFVVVIDMRSVDRLCLDLIFTVS